LALTLHGFCRNVAAEMRAVEMDFSLLPVAAGVLACRRAGASRPAKKTHNNPALSMLS